MEDFKWIEGAREDGRGRGEYDVENRSLYDVALPCIGSVCVSTHDAKVWRR